MTHEISENQANVIAIEDLNVKGMMRNRHLARGVADVSLGEFRRQLEYKCARNGKTLVVLSGSSVTGPSDATRSDTKLQASR